MNHHIVDLDAMTLVGITVRTDNSEAGLEKITRHWDDFFKRGIQQKLGLGAEAEICEAYFDYESDANGPYTILLGARLSAHMPPAVEGLTMHHVPGGRYARFHVDDPGGIRGMWQHVWGRDDLDRRYACDFELIGSRGADVYVSLN